MPPPFALRCQARVGAQAFDAAVVDISISGMGTLVYDSRVRLEPGMRVERARIVHPGHPPVLVELEVRHVGRVVDRDGREASRAGCVIIGERRDLEDLVRMFVSDLGGQ